MFKALKKIEKQLEKLNFPQSYEVAMCMTEICPEISELDADMLETARLISEIGELSEQDEISPVSFAMLIKRGSDSFMKVCFYLKTQGFSINEISDTVRVSPAFFNTEISDLKEITKCLKSFKLPRAIRKDNLVFCASIGADELKNRAETVLKYFSEEVLEEMANGFLFYPVRTNPVECIEYAVSKLGKEKAMKMFLENEMVLYWYKDEYERNNIFQTQHARALLVIDNYK